MSTTPYRVERGSYAAPGGDHRDCSVRALMIAARVDYGVAYDACARAGRSRNRGIYPDALFRASLEFSPKAVKIWPRVTLKRFVASGWQGRWILFVRGHFLAVCDGIVHDWDKGVSRAGRQRGAKRIVRVAWRVS